MARKPDGFFFSFEGCDGCGKSTQIQLLAERLTHIGIDVFVAREPGSTRIGEKIRQILLDPEHIELSQECELLLYEAARIQLVNEVILPALDEYGAVILDRYADSTWAYQKGGRELDAASVRAANELGTGGYWPDLTFLLVLDVEESLCRATSGSQADRVELEGLKFQKRVQEAYLELAKEESERIVVIDAEGSPEEVSERVWEALTTEFFPKT